VEPKMCLEIFPPLLFFESFKKLGVNSPLNAVKNSPVKSSGPTFFFVGRFLIIDSISLQLSLLIHSSCVP
jgi:hypothetical protein